ncbi:DUF2024 family protein [Methylicorpusculum oleiharenae]|nr:DUF2024 family protein [Methylicorpusculum oleiharenae]MCD2452539.1 DUF2024 family protein [Methylicorpusculum oleiharenae]
MSISHVFDTYAKTAQGRIMRFDVVLDKKISTNKVSDQLSQFT